MKIMVTTYPFGITDESALTILSDHEVMTNDVERKYSHDEVVERIASFQPDIIIAGTELYTTEILDMVPNLKMISRVGIGYDSVPLEECKKRGIVVTYTPDAPSEAVADLTICQIINMLRRVSRVDLKHEYWSRFIGREIGACNIGIVGCGRIGSRVSQRLQPFNGTAVFTNDIIPGLAERYGTSLKKWEIFTRCDVVTIHIPYNDDNHHYVGTDELRAMKPGSCLVNLSRGGVVDENALEEWLRDNPDCTAAVDTFVDEPYRGPLSYLDNILMTPHLGSCTVRSRIGMEVGASREVLRLLAGEKNANRLA